MSAFKASFVIPTFNCAAWLAPAVESALEQTYKDAEVIIVDDASTDSTKDYLEWLKDPRVNVITNEKNLGRSQSRNIGNKAASGEVIFVLDADDICSPKRVAICMEKFKAGAEFVHGAAVRMDPVGRDLGAMPTDIFNKEKALETLTNGIVHSSVAYSRDFAMRYPYESGRVAELGLDDWACFLKAAIDGVKFDYTPSVLCVYREGVGVTSQRKTEDVLKFKKEYLEGLRVRI